jgi:hypothetical protein
MNPDLIPEDDPETVCSIIGHDWYALVDQYDTEMAECARCGDVMGAA